MILELYMKYYEQFNGKFTTAGTSKPRDMLPISQKDCDSISSTYVRALQDFVVRGIKHLDGGSASFEVLFLKELSKAENRRTIESLLSGLQVPQMIILRMISIAVWAEEMGLMKACSSFLKLYNKGTQPKEEDMEVFLAHESYIQQNTYFGMLLKTIYDLRQRVSRYKETKQRELEDLQNNISSEDINDMLGI